MEVHNYTLLIVESPTVKRVIDQFDLPYLEVIATEGFCWKPHFDNASRKLSYRADPEKRDIRRRIKEQAQWAASIVVAADNDASGWFIIHTLGRFLKKFHLRKTNITALTPAHIQEAIDTAIKISSDDIERYHLKLQNRYRFHIQFKQRISESNREPDLVTLGVLCYFYSSVPRSRWVDLHSGSMLWTDHPVESTCNEPLELVETGSSSEYLITETPWSTADLLAQSVPMFDDKPGYADQQELINRLFTQTDTRGRGIISYPRTAARGFYPQSWQHLKNQWIHYHPVNTFIPEAAQSTVAEEESHEAIYPLNLENTPEEIRTQMPKAQYETYRLLYGHHGETLRLPETRDFITLTTNNNARFYVSVDEWQPADTLQVKPKTTLADMLYFLSDIGVLRPSKYGSTVDALQASGWIQVQDQRVTPGPKAAEHGQAMNCNKLNNRLRTIDAQLSKNNALSIDRIKEMVDSITQLL